MLFVSRPLEIFPAWPGCWKCNKNVIFEVVYDGWTEGWVVIIIILLNISFLVSLAGGWVQNDHALYPNIGARTFLMVRSINIWGTFWGGYLEVKLYA